MLSRNYITVLNIYLIIVSIIAAFISGVILSFNFKIGIFLFLIIISIYFYFVFFYIKRYFIRFDCKITKNKIIIRNGVFFQKQTYLISSNVQCVNIHTTPLQKKFEIYTISLKFPGKTINIWGLDYSTIHHILEYLEKVNSNESK